MKIIDNLLEYNNNSLFCVATIGNFDGIHLGHQKILQQVIYSAKQFNLPSTVIVFEPQPQEFFLKDQAQGRLTNLNEKLFYFEKLGIDQVFILQFDSELKNLSAERFIQQLLIDKIKVQHLIIGDDFKFGADRSGDFNLLTQNNRFTVSNTDTVVLAGKRVSSSWVREALAADDFVVAEKLLGRPYSMRGTVIHGDKIGRKLNAPTANVDPKRLVLPIKGIFAVTVNALDKLYYGVASLGNRPTLDGKKTLLEPYLFDFDDDLYGKIIEIAFRHKIRDEQKFDSFDALKQQIQWDISSAKTFFDNYSLNK